MANSLFRKIVSLAILTLILTITLTPCFVRNAIAETTIISITPSTAKVGTLVQLNGTITTENGTYTIKFDKDNVASQEATEYEVNATFNVPNTYAGNHNVTLIDDETGENYTATLTVLTSYSLEIAPVEPPKQQRQEGDSAVILANITGGDPSKLYVANVTVQIPTNASYVKLLDISTSDKGNGTTTASFPDDFLSGNPNANTNFTGQYVVFFNTTLATQTFTVGMTNSTTYHRFDLVDIKATGYQPDENVTIAIRSEGTMIHSDSANATGGGIVYANWTVPSNATIGTYTLNLTSTFANTTKTAAPDIQSFTVPGFDINVTTRNLAGEPVSTVIVTVFENATFVQNSTESDDQGLASLTLEIGNYTGEAYFRQQNVGERWLNVTGAMSFDFECNLTNIRVLVKALVRGAEIMIPEAGIFLTPENLTATTNITGLAEFHSLLPNVTYALNVSRYDMPFNVTTIPSLFVSGNAVGWFDVNISCPTLTLQVNVTNPNANDQPISNATVKLRELMGGIFYESQTDADGAAMFEAVFGNYTAEVYEEHGIKLTETSVKLFENKNVSISCNLYGLVVTIKVVDYFGQPIPSRNVTLQREGLGVYSKLTQSDGTATFDNIVGGNINVTVYVADQTQPHLVTSFYVDRSTTIEIRVEKYVVLFGFLVETVHLILAAIIIVAVVFILSLEVYRRRRRKPQENES